MRSAVLLSFLFLWAKKRDGTHLFLRSNKTQKRPEKHDTINNRKQHGNKHENSKFVEKFGNAELDKGCGDDGHTTAEDDATANLPQGIAKPSEAVIILRVAIFSR